MMRISGLFALAFAFAVGLAACGDDDKRTDEQTSQSELTDAERAAAHTTQSSGPIDSVVKHSADLSTGCTGCGPLPDPWTTEQKSGPLPDPWKASSGGGGNGGSGSSTQTGSGTENPHK